MKSAMTKKLAVRKETLRSISTRDLAGAAGGTSTMVGSAEAYTAGQGFIMQDSKIVPTSRR